MPRLVAQKNYILERLGDMSQFIFPTKKYPISFPVHIIFSIYGLWTSAYFGYYFLVALMNLIKMPGKIFQITSPIMHTDIFGILAIGTLFIFSGIISYTSVGSLL